MNSQEYCNLQEAYLDVYENGQLDEGYKPPAGKMAKRVAHKMFKAGNAIRKAVNSGETSDTAGGQVMVQKTDKLANQAQKIYQTAKRHNPEASKEKERQNRAVGDTSREVGPRSAASLRDRYNRGGSSTNTPKKKNGYGKDIRDGIINGVSDALGEQVDLYDIILSHLLDEGYADTEEAALAIMGNMSKEWMGNIMEKKYEPDEELPGSGLTPSRKYRIKRKEFLKHSKDSYQGPYAGLATKSGVRIHPDDPKETGRTRAHRMTSNYNSSKK